MKKTNKPKRRYWKKSSRWRAAYKAAKPDSRHRYLLYRLAQGWIVFAKPLPSEYLGEWCWRNSDWLSGKIFEHMTTVSPWLLVAEPRPFPELLGKSILMKQSFTQKVLDKAFAFFKRTSLEPTYIGGVPYFIHV